jgi:hypothetical protein
MIELMSAGQVICGAASDGGVGPAGVSGFDPHASASAHPNAATTTRREQIEGNTV